LSLDNISEKPPKGGFLEWTQLSIDSARVPPINKDASLHLKTI